MNNRKVRRCARPIDIRNGNRRAVLCIHGFTGYPGEMAYPASRLADSGWDVRVPRLTGHGTDGKNFSESWPEMWARQVADEWLNLKADYDRVCVLGHSMGGLLTLNLITGYPVDRAAVMAPAIGVKGPPRFIMSLMALVFRKKKMPWKPDPAYTFFDDRDTDDDEYLGAEYWSWAWIPQISRLQKMMYRTQRKLPAVVTPVLGIFGGRDEIVGSGGKIVLEKRMVSEFRALVLEESGHYIPYEPTPGVKEKAMDAVLDWFEKE